MICSLCLKGLICLLSPVGLYNFAKGDHSDIIIWTSFILANFIELSVSPYWFIILLVYSLYYLFSIKFNIKFLFCVGLSLRQGLINHCGHHTPTPWKWPYHYYTEAGIQDRYSVPLHYWGGKTGPLQPTITTYHNTAEAGIQNILLEVFLEVTINVDMFDFHRWTTKIMSFV